MIFKSSTDVLSFLWGWPKGAISAAPAVSYRRKHDKIQLKRCSVARQNCEKQNSLYDTHCFGWFTQFSWIITYVLMISTLWKHTGLIWKHHLLCLSALKRKICTSRKFRKNALCCENKRKGLPDQTGNSDLCWKNNYTNEKARLWLTQPQQLFYRYKSDQVWAQWGWVIWEKYAISNFSDIVHTSLNVIWSLFQTRKMYITDFYLFTF